MGDAARERHSEVLSVDRADGNRRWGRPGLGAVVVGERLWVWAGDGSLAVLDPGTGDVIREI